MTRLYHSTHRHSEQQAVDAVRRSFATQGGRSEVLHVGRLQPRLDRDDTIIPYWYGLGYSETRGQVEITIDDSLASDSLWVR